MKKFVSFVLGTSLCLCFAPMLQANMTFDPGQTPQDMQKVITFMTATGNTFGDGTIGLTLTGTAGALSGKILPVSFYSSVDYWLYYVGQNSHVLIDVTDTVHYPPFSLTPNPCSSNPNLGFPTFLCPGDCQTERLNAFVGVDIYDAAVWQIALALAGADGLTGPGGASLFDIAENQTLQLTKGSYSYQDNTENNLRAITDGDVFTYNGQSITDPENAYFFRLIPPAFISNDPLKYVKPPLSVSDFISTDPDPLAPPLEKGNVTWQDFKPITGENAWAFLLGPLHKELIEQQHESKTFIPYMTPAVQNAKNVLLAFQYMQAPIGSIYYITGGALGNIGPVDPYTVSMENNFSVLGGLFALKRMLSEALQYETTLSEAEKQEISNSLDRINAMIFGGTIEAESGTRETQGMLSFFENYGWNHDESIFYQGGLADSPQQSSEWVPTTEPKAVDVNTWGLACLGQEKIDQWFGFGTAYQLWIKTKAFGGFYSNDEIWGVGFSDQDGNSIDNQSGSGVISAEWSAGAINMVRCLITQYTNVVNDPTHYTQEQLDAAQGYLTDLQKDHDQMLKNIMALRTDYYSQDSTYNWCTYKPSNYNELMWGITPIDRLAFLYANRRYQIPFGWISNPIPSAASTGWMVFIYYNYNPFNPNGTYEVNPDLTYLPPTVSNTYNVQRMKNTKTDKVNKFRSLYQ